MFFFRSFLPGGIAFAFSLLSAFPFDHALGAQAPERLGRSAHGVLQTAVGQAWQRAQRTVHASTAAENAAETAPSESRLVCAEGEDGEPARAPRQACPQRAAARAYRHYSFVQRESGAFVPLQHCCMSCRLHDMVFHLLFFPFSSACRLIYCLFSFLQVLFTTSK